MTLPAGLTTDANAALPLHIVTRAEFAQWCTTQPTAVARWLDAQAFDGSAYTALVVPGADGAIASAVIGVGDRLDPASYGHAPFALPDESVDDRAETRSAQSARRQGRPASPVAVAVVGSASGRREFQ